MIIRRFVSASSFDHRMTGITGPRSSMNRISDFGSDDEGLIPSEATNTQYMF